MGIWPFNRQKEILPEFLDIEVYVRNELNILRVEEAVNIAIALSKGPNCHYGIEIPDGNFISSTHFLRLPENLKKFFDKETIQFKRKKNV